MEHPVRVTTLGPSPTSSVDSAHCLFYQHSRRIPAGVNQKEYVMSIGKRITAALGVLATTAVLFLAGTGAGTANAAPFGVYVHPTHLTHLTHLAGLPNLP
jgi:hypothetical protein